MQGITREMNFSETTFVLPSYSTVEKCFRKVRIFTPGREIPFAGHPTLGTAFVLKNKEIIREEEKRIYLELGIGPIAVEFNDQNNVQMFQAKPEFLDEFQDRSKIASILGIRKEDISEKWPLQFVSTGFPFLIIPLNSLTAIQSINLTTNLLFESLATYPSQEILIFSTDTIHEDSHVHVRMFAPSAGVFEDPATGSAAGPLGAYLETHQVLKNHKKGTKIVLEQGYELNRPSKLVVTCLFDNEISEVIVEGSVRKTAEGTFFL
jgi:trans-2,3-dihydro-3-hydroxyanthranilate isomerase